MFYTQFKDSNGTPVIPDFIENVTNAFQNVQMIENSNGEILGWVFDHEGNEIEAAHVLRNVIPDSHDGNGIAWVSPVDVDTDLTNERKTAWMPENLKSVIVDIREIVNNG